MSGQVTTSDQSRSSLGSPTTHQENIELEEVTQPGDLILVPTDQEKPHPPYESPSKSQLLTPLVVQVERRSSHSKSDDGSDPKDDLDLAPDALNSLTVKNQFTVRKMAAQGLIDVALMMANISQLRTLITAGSDLDNYELLLTMVCFSLAAQIIFAIIIFIIYMREAEESQREEFMATLRQGDVESLSCSERTKAYRSRIETKFRRHQITNRLNFITIVLVFVITVINMFITGFGIKLGKRGQEVTIFDERERGAETFNFNATVGGVISLPMNMSSPLLPYQNDTITPLPTPWTDIVVR